MLNLISMKTISASAIAFSLLLGTLAASPVSTAFAKSAFNKTSGANSEVTVTSHRRTGLIFDGGSLKSGYRQAFRLGNRSISHQ